jgi:methionyl aminopeptidase
MTADSKADIDGLLAAGRIVRAAFEQMKAAARAGITTAELDAIGGNVLRSRGARSAPQAMYDFPGATCISVNEQAAHGIPGPRRLMPGDVVNIDVSAEFGGYIADMGESFVLAPIAPERARICRAVRQAVHEALKRVRAGRSLNVIGHTVQRVADHHGYRIVRNLASHGVGRTLHEEPSYVPLHNPREKRTLHRGMVLTIEPFFTTDTDDVTEMGDGWTLTCGRGELVAQFEHTIVVTDGAPIVITA